MAPEGLDEDIEFCLLTVSRGISIEGREDVVVVSREGAIPAILMPTAPVFALPAVAAVLMLRWLTLDEALCRREGVGGLEPDKY